MEIQNVLTLSILPLVLTFNFCLIKPSRRPHILFVHLMNHITAQLKRDSQTWLLNSGIVLQTSSQQDFTTANFWGRRQLWMHTQNFYNVQSHLMQAKWFRFSLIFFLFFFCDLVSFHSVVGIFQVYGTFWFLFEITGCIC